MPPPPPVSTDEDPGEGRAPGEYPIADVWPRIGARVLDFVVAGMLIGYLVQIAIRGDVEAPGPDSDASNSELFVAGLASVAVWFVWEVVVTAWKGGSPMKLALGLRVVRADDRRVVGWKESLVRWAVLAAWGLLPVIGLFVQILLLGVSLVFLFSRPMRQTVWDLGAKTLVVRAR